MLTIGICGASGSGKSTLARALAERIRGGAVLLNQDVYYLDHPNLTDDERARINYDEPDAFDHDLLYADLCALSRGETILRKGYDFTLHRRADTKERVTPGSALILEGIHCFYDPRVRELLDFKLYMSVDADICLLRRVQRDVEERGRSLDGVARQYLETVKPMFERYVRGYVEYADLIVAGGGRNQRIVDVLACYINSGGIEDK